MFSVIIPLYNKSHYIEKAIQSVINQTFNDFELIIVNDGSTDNSLYKLESILKVLESKKPEYFKKIRILNQINLGVSEARNNGAVLANYDYIAFLDADDWWENTYLEEMNNFINDFPEAAVYGCSYYLIKKGKKYEANVGVDYASFKGLINYFKVYEKTFYMPLWVGSTIISKKIFFEEKGFKSFLKYGEDFDLWIRLALKYPIAFLNRHLSNYNQDVDFNYRAMDGKLHPVETDFLFHTSYLVKYEISNNDLSRLLDKFRLYSLFQYYVDPEWYKVAKKELLRVKVSNMTFTDILKYKLPIGLVRYFNYLWGKIYLLKNKYYH